MNWGRLLFNPPKLINCLEKINMIFNYMNGLTMGRESHIKLQDCNVGGD